MQHSSDWWFLRMPAHIRDSLEQIARPQGNNAASIARQILQSYLTEQAISQGRQQSNNSR
jgi:hypothetical protein